MTRLTDADKLQVFTFLLAILAFYFWCELQGAEREIANCLTERLDFLTKLTKR